MNEKDMKLIERAFRAGFSMGSDKGDDPCVLFYRTIISNPDIAWDAYKNTILKKELEGD